MQVGRDGTLTFSWNSPLYFDETFTHEGHEQKIYGVGISHNEYTSDVYYVGIGTDFTDFLKKYGLYAADAAYTLSAVSKFGLKYKTNEGNVANVYNLKGLPNSSKAATKIKWIKAGGNTLLFIGVLISAKDVIIALDNGDTEAAGIATCDCVAGIIFSRFGLIGIPLYASYIITMKTLPPTGYQNPIIPMRDNTRTVTPSYP